MMPGDTFGQWLNLLFGLVLAKEEDQDSSRSQGAVDYRSFLLRYWIIRFFRRKWFY
jgi:hypothetical protein